MNSYTPESKAKTQITSQTFMIHPHASVCCTEPGHLSQLTLNKKDKPVVPHPRVQEVPHALANATFTDQEGFSKQMKGPSIQGSTR